MIASRQYLTKIASSILLISFTLTWGWTSPTQAETLDGVGKLKFGMTPSAVEALKGCSSETECLYEILGKNRYFTLRYGGNGSTSHMESPRSPTGTLTHIDIDMGNHTREWFGELYEVLLAQYPVSHVPTEQEDTQFMNGTNQELIIGFAEGAVLLKIVRRKFGNMILRVVYQDDTAANAQRQQWNQGRIE